MALFDDIRSKLEGVRQKSWIFGAPTPNRARRMADAVAELLRSMIEDGDPTPIGASIVPSGTTFPFAGDTVPSGYLECDGSEVSREDFADLFAAIGTLHGAGDGSTTFNLPDGRGRTFIGRGQGSGLTNRSVGDTGGEEEVTLDTTTLPEHSHAMFHDHDMSHGHTVTDPGHTHSVRSESGVGTVATLDIVSAGAGSFGTTIDTTGLTVDNHNGNTGASSADTTSPSGGGNPHNNMQPFWAGMWIIKT